MKLFHQRLLLITLDLSIFLFFLALSELLQTFIEKDQKSEVPYSKQVYDE